MISFKSQLKAKKISQKGPVFDYGIISARIITTAFLEHLIDAFQSSGTDISTFNFHDTGVGTTAAVIGNTTLESKVEIGRSTGTQEEHDSITYKTVATITYTSNLNITEHGVFSAETDGVLLDRSVFDPIEVWEQDVIEYTYILTLEATAIEIIVSAECDLTAIAAKIQTLEHYLKCLAPSVYALGTQITTQDKDTYERVIKDIDTKIQSLETDDNEVARYNFDLYKQLYGAAPEETLIEQEEQVKAEKEQGKVVLKQTKAELEGTRVELEQVRKESEEIKEESGGTREELKGTGIELEETRIELEGTRIELQQTRIEAGMATKPDEPQQKWFGFRSDVKKLEPEKTEEIEK